MTGQGIEEVTVSATRLSSAQPADDPSVERLRRMVRSGGPSLTILRVGASDLRRVDVWVRSGDIGLVPYQRDSDAAVPCGYGSGAEGSSLIMEILAEPVVVNELDGLTRRFPEVGALVSEVTAGADPTGCATVVHSHVDDRDLARLTGAGVVWGAAGTGEALELRPDGEASYWAEVLRMLSSANVT